MTKQNDTALSLRRTLHNAELHQNLVTQFKNADAAQFAMVILRNSLETSVKHSSDMDEHEKVYESLWDEMIKSLMEAPTFNADVMNQSVRLGCALSYCSEIEFAGHVPAFKLSALNPAAATIDLMPVFKIYLESPVHPLPKQLAMTVGIRDDGTFEWNANSSVVDKFLAEYAAAAKKPQPTTAKKERVRKQTTSQGKTYAAAR